MIPTFQAGQFGRSVIGAAGSDPTSTGLWHMDTNLNAAVGEQNMVQQFNAPSISSVQSKFGGASLRLPNGAARTDPNASLIVFDADGTLDFWFYESTRKADVWLWTVSQNASNYVGLRLVSGVPRLQSVAAGVITTLITGSTTNTVGAWRHYAVTRSGGTFYLFSGGTVEGTSGTAPVVLTNAEITIGATYRLTSSTNMPDGYAEEIRTIKGTAAWSATFTPPVAAYTS